MSVVPDALFSLRFTFRVLHACVLVATTAGKEFLGDKKKWVLIRRMHILVPGEGPGAERYIELSQSPLVIPED